MTNALYLQDSYMKEFDANVVSVSGEGDKSGKFIILDHTYFYPNSGGQPWDEGVMVANGEEFRVVFVGKFSGEISHEVDHTGLNPGDHVKCRIDWKRRHVLMRMHTAAHILSAVINRETGALITGNQLGLDKSRIDFSLDNFDRERLGEYIRIANEHISRNYNVHVSEMRREDVEKDSQLVKLAKGLPPGIEMLRMVEIAGLDKQPDGGTHVSSTREIGRIELVDCENKGKNNRRIYFVLRE